MNSMGERIYELRKQNNMSQGDLADKLDVSRQTVSKWENNSSIPEVEKLIQLSEIFGVSTDYILKNQKQDPDLKEEKQQPDLKEQKQQSDPVYVYVKDTDSKNVYMHNEAIVRKYVGIVLAILGGLLTVFLLITGGGVILAGIPTGSITLIGILLACNTKHPWLVASWVTYVVTVVTLPFYTVLSPLLIFDPVIYTEGYLAHLVFAYAVWIILALLIFVTVKAKRGYIIKKKDIE